MAKWVEPVKVELQGNLTFYSIPPPGSGLITAFILNTLDRLIPRKEEVEKEALTYHHIAQVFKYANAQQIKLSDPTSNLDQVR